MKIQNCMISVTTWAPFHKSRKSYDFRLILRTLTDQVCHRFTKLFGMFFYDFRFTTCGCEVFFVRRYTNRSISRAAHLSDKFIIRSSKILNTVILMVYVVTKNIKYSYFWGLCRYKSRETLRK